MGRPRVRNILLSLFALIALGISIGCQDMIMGSSPFNWLTPMKHFWPNQDGMEWAYHYAIRSWDSNGMTIFDDPADVPPVPSMTEVMGMLTSLPAVEGANVEDYGFNMKFDGMVTTIPGITAQNLVESLDMFTGEATPVAGLHASDRFLSRLAVARPDLRERIIPRLSPEAALVFARLDNPLENNNMKGKVIVGGPLLIHGGTWEKASQYIGTYGDVDTLLAWKFLTYHVRTGAEFTHQLVPSLASDVFLHARVLGRLNIRTKAGLFKNALRVVYVIDYGIFEHKGIEQIGYWRVYDYGYVDYVPNVGPVASYERRLIDAGNPESLGVGESTLDLMNTNMSE